MKKMMKAVAVILSATMALSMAGCGSKKVDPKELFDTAIKKNAELKDMDMDTAMTMQIAQGENTMEMTMKMNTKISETNTDKMQYLAKGTTSMSGQSVDSTIFYKDGYYYIETQGQKIKYAMDLKELMDSVKKTTDSANMASDQMKELTAKADGDNQILTFTADPEKMDSYMDEMLSSMGDQMGALEGLEMSFKEASGEYTINKDGYYTAMKIKMVVDMTMNGETITMNIDSNMTVNNPGQAVEITLPDTEGYEEIQMPSSGQNNAGEPEAAPEESEAA